MTGELPLYFFAKIQKKGGRVPARKKISDSILHGFGAKGNRKNPNGFGDVIAAVWGAIGDYGQWGEGQPGLQGNCEAGGNPLLDSQASL